ncbi:MAG: ring-cleaving dioxygenase [Caldilineaceae bacterium]
MQTNGIHHITAVSAQIGRNADFYTRVLGLRLVKKSVNQDDTSAYHLFYADKIGSPGTDMTFFDWASAPRERRGSDSFAATAFRVPSQDALVWWQARLDAEGIGQTEIETFAGHTVLRFDDPEGQRLMLVDDGGAAYDGEYWADGGVPEAYALRGFYAALIVTPRPDQMEQILTRVLNYREVARTPQAIVYATGEGGPGRELWVMEDRSAPANPGAGGVHHVALRVADAEEQAVWRKHLTDLGLGVSEFIDRFWFKSIYFRVSRGLLFEIATDGPGFAVDEHPDALGEKLVLPPFLEERRPQIEAGLKPITVGK